MPKQFGTGHWKSYGNGPRGSSKRVGLIKNLEKLLPPQKWFFNNIYQIAATAGLQNTGIVASIYTPHDLYTYNGSAGTGDGSIGNKVILKDYSCSINFTNQTNANVKVQMYDIISRRDNFVLNTSYVEDPLVAWQQAIVGGGYHTTWYGATPFDSPLFTKYFKVIGSQEYRLAEGETGEHIVKHKMNKPFDMSVLSGIGTAGTQNAFPVNEGGFKGLTYYAIAVVSGAPTDANNSTVTTSIATVDFVTVNAYTFEYITAEGAYIAQLNNLGTVAGQAFNQGSGAAVTVATV
jgi:hypothetical protein